MEEIIRGDIFIVPNSLQICDDHGSYGYNVQDVTGLQVCFEAWMTNDECENWSCHYYDKFNKKRISDRMPVELFIGKREGDTVEVTINGIKAILTCAQKSYRYSSDSFENLMYHLTQSFGGLVDASYFSPPLTNESQRAMIIANHERYARSLGFGPKNPETFRHNKPLEAAINTETNETKEVPATTDNGRFCIFDKLCKWYTG